MKHAIKYWIIVFRESIRMVVKVFDVKERLILMILYYPILFALSFFTAKGIININLIRALKNDFRSEIVLTFGVFIILVFLHMIWIPPKLYKGMGGFDKWNIKPAPEDKGDGKPQKNIGIRFYNEMQNDVSDFFVEIVSIVSIKKTRTGQELLSNPENLLFSTRHLPQNQEKNLKGKRNLLVSVAETLSEENEIWITTWKRRRPHKLVPGTYQLSILVHGKMNKYFREEYKFYIKYEGGTKLFFRPRKILHI